jgi:hypothetical protein
VDLVYKNLIDCTARITIPNEQGTGFFVSSGLLLTCRHVVKETSTDEIQVFWRGNPYTPTKIERHPELDLALLWVDITNHLYVALDEYCNPYHECYTYGYPPDNIGTNGALCIVEGFNEDGAKMSVLSKGIRPGLSGAPLLNNKTNKVCGLIIQDLQVRMRQNTLQGFGGMGIPVKKIFEVYPELKKIEPHPEWLIENSQGTEQKFIEALHEFNYTDEVGIFAKLLEADTPVGAFLICGKEQAGQTWLLNRLWRDEVPTSTSGVKYRLKVSKDWTIEMMWERVGKVLDVAADPEIIAQKMYEHWQNSVPVALILYRVEKLKKPVLRQLIEQLWKPLANLAKESLAEVPLLLFLLDTGEDDNTIMDYLITESKYEYDSNSPDIPVYLRLKENFFDKDINFWVRRHKETIAPLFGKYCLTKNLDCNEQPIKIFKTQIKNYIRGTSTTPEDVLQKICQFCNHDWQEDFESKFVI